MRRVGTCIHSRRAGSAGPGSAGSLWITALKHPIWVTLVRVTAPQTLRDDLASPPARRSRVRTWRDPRLVVGVALVAGSGLLGATLLAGDDTVAVWAVAESLETGSPVAADALQRREVGLSADEASVYLPAAEPLPAGTVLARPVGAGELLPRAALASGEPAVVEVPLSVPVDQVPVTARVGSVVDVWVTSDPAIGGESAREAVRVLEDVRVVELPRSTGLGAGGTRQVVVALPVEREGDLPRALAQVAQGTVVLVRTP